MSNGARRLLCRDWPRFVRRVWPALLLWFVVSAFPTHAKPSSKCVSGDGHQIRKVCLEEQPGTPAYGHEVLGETPEWDALTVFWGPTGRQKQNGAKGSSTFLQPDHIFEDTHPRLIDLDSDGFDEIVVVQTSFGQGARLVVLGTMNGLELVTQTPYIGRTHRWLAPLGAADLDGDGTIELAYVDRPHLAKTLRVWRYENRRLIHVADQPGLTNHRIGEDYISGGIRTCAGQPEIITASADWTRLIASTLNNGRITTRDISAHTGPASFKAALFCH